MSLHSITRQGNVNDRQPLYDKTLHHLSTGRHQPGGDSELPASARQSHAAFRRAVASSSEDARTRSCLS